MNILIVDDNPRRYDRLVAALEGKGLDRNEIDIVVSTNDARDKLQDKLYDLMIIDIIIPLRPEDLPSEHHSRDLLTELIDFEELCRPLHVVGLSAFAPSADNIVPFFRDNVWTVISYSDSNDDWLQQILNCIDFIKGRSHPSGLDRSKVDIVIVCALHDPELRAVLQLPWNWSAAKPIDDTTFVHEGSFEIDGRPVSVAAAAATRMGMVSAALLTSKLIAGLSPRFIAMAGICAGVKGKAGIGDVLLADPSWDWQSGKRVRDKENAVFSIAPHQLGVAPAIRSRVEQLKADRVALMKIAEGWVADIRDPPKIVIGPVASGSAVLADGDVVSEIKNQQRDLCGIEMEAYGVYSAASLADSPQPITFAMKSVCDFADPDKADDHQRYAAYTSASTIRLFFERYFFQLLRSDS